MRRTFLALGLTLLSCSSGDGLRPRGDAGSPDGNWDRQVARAAAARAEDLAALGDTERARVAAEQALAAARRAGSGPDEARALALLGRLSGSIEVVTQAAELARELGDRQVGRGTELLLAEQLLAEGDALAALVVGDRLLADLGDPDHSPDATREERGRLEARVQHLRCRALRRLGRWGELDLAARRARLALSLLPADELPALRFAVDMDVAQGYAAAGHFGEAFNVHVQASLQARAAGDLLGECLALRGMAADLTGLGRERDAVTHIERAYLVARKLGAAELSQQLAKQGLAMLHDLDEPLDSPRLANFRAALLGDA